MINFSSVRISGAFNFARARAIWHEGLLRVFTLHGPVMEVMSEEPVKQPGHLNTWELDTARGMITVKGKCITCGGRKWWKIVATPTEQMWSTPW